MKLPAVELVFVLLLDSVLGLSEHRDEMTGRSGGFRRTVRRQQAVRLPLYMMRLYRTMRTEDRPRTRPAGMGQPTGEHGGLHHSDSVINLVAKGEFNSKFLPFICI